MKHIQKLFLLLLFLLTSWVGVAQQVHVLDSVPVVDTLDATATRQITFAASATQNYGFDAREVSAWTENYETIKMGDGGNYFVPYKSVGENQTDEVVAHVQIEGYEATLLSFKTKSGTTLTHTAAGSNDFKMQVPANAEAVYAYYGNQKLGKLNVKSQKPLARKMVIVPVNNTAYSTTNLLQNVNNVYKQANVTWTVTTATNFNFDMGTDGLEAADATLFSKYSTEMRALRDAYIAHDSTYDKNAYYLFVVPKFTDASQVGYMVRGKGLGFISPTATARDIAHELAHGAFGLEHTFPNPPQGSTTNLMDYSQGSNLTKKQWDKIHSPMPVINWLDEEEDGSYITINNLASIPNELKNSDGSISFFTPGLKIITLPASTKSIRISISDRMVYSSNNNTAFYTTIGSLLGFTDKNGVKYKSYGGNKSFTCYQTGAGVVYYDLLTKEHFNETKKGNPLIGIPYVDFKTIKIDLVKSKIVLDQDYAGSNSDKYTGSDIGELTSDIILDRAKKISINTGDEFERGYPIELSLNDINWTNETLFLQFLEANNTKTGRTSIYAPILIAHAFQLSFFQINANCFDDELKQELFKIPISVYTQSEYNSNPNNISNAYLSIYNILKTSISKYEDFQLLANRINLKIKNISSPTEMKNYFIDSIGYVKCLYDEIEWENRIHAINVLLSNQNFGIPSVSNTIENIVTMLIETTKRNGQSQLLYAELKNNNYLLFNKLWNGFQLGNFTVLMQEISSIVMLYENFQYDPNNISDVVNTPVFYFKNKADDRQYMPSLKYKYILSNSVCKLTNYFTAQASQSDNVDYFWTNNLTPFDIVRFEFPKNNCISFNGINGQNGASFFAPAFYGAWIINSYNNERVITQVVDGAIIISGVVSGGVVGLIDVVVAGTDLIILANKNNLESSASGQMVFNAFEDVRDAYYLAVGTAAAVQVGNSIIRMEVNLTKVSEKSFDELSSFQASLLKLQSALFGIGKSASAEMLRSKLVFDIYWKSIIQNVKNITNNSVLKIQNQIRVYAFSSLLNYNVVVADIAIQGSESYLKLARFKNGVSGTVLHEIENISYTLPGTNYIKSGTLELVKDSKGALIWREALALNGAGNTLFNKSIIENINGFSDNITTLVSQQGIDLTTFKNIEELSVADLLQSPNLTKINTIRNSIPMPDANTLMQKVIPKSDIQKYVSGQYKSCKGFMSTAKDSKHLNSYDDIYYGMRLDYQGSAFSISDGSCGVIRFKAPNANTAIVPRSSNNVLAGVDDALFPYTGHGFTSGTNGRLGVPEWKMNSFADLQNGEAELYEVFSNGTEVLKARFDKQLGQFVPIQ